MYLEAYTSILMVPKEKLVSAALLYSRNHLKALCKEEFYGRPVIVADREMVELQSDEILRDADKEDVSLLIVGDPFEYVSLGVSNSIILTCNSLRQRDDS